ATAWRLTDPGLLRSYSAATTHGHAELFPAGLWGVAALQLLDPAHGKAVGPSLPPLLRSLGLPGALLKNRSSPRHPGRTLARPSLNTVAFAPVGTSNTVPFLPPVFVPSR